MTAVLHTFGPGGLPDSPLRHRRGISRPSGISIILLSPELSPPKAADGGLDSVTQELSSDRSRPAAESKLFMSAKRAFLFLTISLAMTVSACSGRYGKPAAVAPASIHSDSGISDGNLIVTGLVEFGDSFPMRHRPKGTGDLTIAPDRISWSNSNDEDRSFSIRPAAVKSITMQCVSRAGSNICLELQMETITGLTYSFRDVDWAGGYNQRIRRTRDYLVQNFPRIVFAEKMVDEIS